MKVGEFVDQPKNYQLSVLCCFVDDKYITSFWQSKHDYSHPPTQRLLSLQPLHLADINSLFFVMSIYTNFWHYLTNSSKKDNGPISGFDSTLLDSCESILYYLDKILQLFKIKLM